LVVAAGNVIIKNVTFTTATDAPTIRVTGGHLLLRNDLIQESTGYNNAAIAVSGGSVDLGTPASPGGHTINVNGSGRLILNTGPNLVTVVGNTFKVNDSVVQPLTNTVLTSSAGTSTLNQSVTFTVTVTAATTGTGTPTGSVTLVDTTTGATL